MAKLIRLLICVFLLPLGISAASSHVEVELLQEEESIQAGRPFWVAVQLAVEDGWHVYWKNPGEVGMSLQVDWQLPPGFTAGPLQWPVPKKLELAGILSFGYEGEVTLLSQITPPSQLPLADQPLSAQVKWLVCSEMGCQPGSAAAPLILKVRDQVPQPNAQLSTLFTQFRHKLPQPASATRTILKEGEVQIVLSQGELSRQDALIGAYFFSEQKDVIDQHINPILIADASDDPYLINLKSSAFATQAKTLKGVLVLQTKNGVKSLEIDSPLQPEAAPLSLQPTTASPANASLAKNSFRFTGGMGYALLLAFVGGMILNLMPCVLPVLSFKVMSFVKMAGESRALTIRHGLVFSLGVLASFWLLAGVMLILREYGQAVGWGFQLQQPLFVALLASLLFVFGLSLFGVFEIGLSVASWAGQTQSETRQHPGYLSSLMSGVLATAVATPCTGPFLGSAVGFAFTLPIPQALLIFTSLALGMCFPYLILSFFPACLRFIPKPGLWMETFKQLMGFILMATVLWLVWVFSAQTDTFSLICLLAGFLLFALASWIYGKGCVPSVSSFKRLIAYLCVLLLAMGGVQAILFPRASWQHLSAQEGTGVVADGWENFSPQRVAQLRAEGKPILIDFTAKWCLVCQVNHGVISTDSVEKRLAERGVVKMKADWTKNDPVITAELAKFERSSVPLYLLYGSEGQKDPIILPQVLTSEILLSSIDKIAPGSVVAEK